MSTELINAFASFKNVMPFMTDEQVFSSACVQRVVALSAIERIIGSPADESVMARVAEENVIIVASADGVVTGGADDALVADFGLDGVVEAAVGVAFEWLENDEGLKCCGLAAQHAGATEDE